MRRFKKNAYFYQLLLIICIEAILAFSVYGYITVKPISISFMHIPVIVGAMLLGPGAGAVLGLAFGLTSMWKASVTATLYSDIVFSPFLSGNPLASLLLSLGARMLFGLVAGVLFLAVKKRSALRPLTAAGIGVVSEWLHSFFVYSVMQVCFPLTGIGVMQAFTKFLRPSTWVSYLITALATAAFYALSQKEAFQTFFHNLYGSDRMRTRETAVPLFASLFLLISIAVGVAIHFYGRMESVLKSNGLQLSPHLAFQFTQLELQYLVSTVALSFVVATIISSFQMHTIQLRTKAQIDALTGIYNRAAFTQLVEERLERKDQPDALFLMLDIDDFKHINDTFGHPCGDRVLIGIAQALLHKFNRDTIVGRIGGDEFAVFFPWEGNLPDKLGRLFEEVSALPLPDGQVTCSIGVAVCGGKEDFSALYQFTDTLLYASKQNGKNCYILDDAYQTT